MVRKLVVKVFLAEVVALTMLGAFQPASTLAAGNVGGFHPNTATCYDKTSITVEPPFMAPAPARNFINGNLYPAQQVAFRARLMQLYNGVWYTVRTGPWWYGTAISSSSYGIPQPLTWRDWPSTGRLMPYPIGFWNLPSGTFANPIYYGVQYDLYWYSDKYRAYGSTWSWVESYQERRGDTGYPVPYQNCKFPGPNWLLGF